MAILDSCHQMQFILLKAESILPICFNFFFTAAGVGYYTVWQNSPELTCTVTVKSIGHFVLSQWWSPNL